MTTETVTSPATAALAKAQREMDAVIKNAQNPHLKNKYADLGAVIDAALPALNANGFALVQPLGRDEHGLYIETRLQHVSGEAFSTRIPLIGALSDMQKLGSAQTYARRYGLLAMAGLAPEDDDGNAASRREQPRDDRPLVEQMGPQPSTKQPAPPVPIAAVLGAMLEKLDMADTLAKLEQLTAKPTFEGALERLHKEDRDGWMEVCARIEAQREALRPPMPDDGIPGLEREPIIVGEHRVAPPPETKEAVQKRMREKFAEGLQGTM